MAIAFLAVIKGLFAGLIGTIVMTLSQMLEMQLTGRQPSTVPGQVASKLLSLSPKNEHEMTSLSNKVHWGHGIALGAVFGLISLAKVTGVAAIAIFFALLWTGDALLYAALGITPLPWHWKANELITDLFHKGVYAITTGVTYQLIA
jgi:hypothetical protein